MSVKDTQGSVEVTSYWQMRKFLNYGHYLIGTSAQSTAVDTIHNLISLKLINTDKQLNKTSYNLEDLRDLESKLVLITGTNANNRMEVDHYLNVSVYTSDVSSMHIHDDVYIASLFADSLSCDQDCRSVAGSTASWQYCILRMDDVI